MSRSGAIKKITASFLVLILLSGCVRQGPAPDISAIDIGKVNIHRYEQALFGVEINNIRKGLDSIHPEYSLFLGNNYADTLNIIRIFEFLTDPMIRDLKQKTDEIFHDLGPLEDGLSEAFGYWKHYFPSDTLPVVYSYISGLYYEAPVEYFNGNMIISLDLYLGSGFEPYRAIGLPMYATRRMTPDFILPECMRQAALSHLPGGYSPRTLLDHMVMHGKVLHFMDAVLPGVPDTLKTGYSREQEAWCQENEDGIWKLLLEDELLYSTDPFIINKFMLDGPFTSGLPKESPAMLGRWIGWQIVRSFMENHPETTMSELFALEDSQKILSDSRYKPSRK